jgi:hypothetical protein
MCRYDGEGRAVPNETPAERRRRQIAQIRAGNHKVNRHTERLRTEAPRVHAALLPLLSDLDEWMGSVSDHLAAEEQRVSRLA